MLAAATLSAQGVTYERIVNALHEQQNWLTYFGDYGAMRHRDLKQITTANVKDLRVEWMFQTGQTGAFQTVPLVVDGVMYITAANGQAFALDARSGRQLWMYRHTFPADQKIALQPNRGMAILGDRVFMVTTDAHLIALEARTGKLVWQAEMAPYTKGQYFATLAPLAVKDKIIVGISGGELGIRGFIDAYDAARPASARGASGRFRPRISPAATPGSPIRGSAAAAPPG